MNTNFNGVSRQNLGIETLTPGELARMNLEWGEKNGRMETS